MKSLISILSLASVSLLFPSCVTEGPDPDSGIPIRMTVSIDSSVENAPEGLFSETEPFHVVAYSYDCPLDPSYSVNFESDAYVDYDGNIHWLDGKNHNWAWEYMKFVAYYPADASMKLDARGDIVSSDCTLVATAKENTSKTGNATLVFTPYVNSLINVNPWNVVNHNNNL